MIFFYRNSPAQQNFIRSKLFAILGYFCTSIILFSEGMQYLIHGERDIHLAKTTLVIFISVLLISECVLADHATVGFGSNLGGPITTISAGTISRGKWLIGTRLEYVKFDAFTNAQLEAFAEAGEEIHSVDNLFTPFLIWGYGVTDAFTLSARFTCVARSNIREGEHEMGSSEVHNDGNPSGLGDLSLFGQFQFVQEGNGLWRLAAVGGLKAPIGKTDWTSDDGEKLEPEHQPGSGSWDFSGGFAFSANISTLAVDGSALYTVATDDEDGINLGNILNYGLSVAYRFGAANKHIHQDGSLHPHEESPIVLDFILEANAEWREKEEHGSIKELNSGGNLVYLSPGIRISGSSGWSGFVSVGLPIAENPNGVQHETDLRLLTGISFTP